ncbi:MAG: cytochrome b [Deltaproteobacteria bacterium]|nr:cytochrome b [Deltaproteobacteria bacterium]
MKKPTDGYTRFSIALHWLTALMLFAVFPLGIYMHELPLSPHKLKLYSWHKWLGVTIFVVIISRLFWRITHQPAFTQDSIKEWERRLAGTVHVILYILIISIPLEGWLMSSAAGFKVVYLGRFPLPELIGKDEHLAESLKFIHKLLNISLLAAFALHVGGVLKHLIIDRDRTIVARMIPFMKRGK